MAGRPTDWRTANNFNGAWCLFTWDMVLDRERLTPHGYEAECTAFEKQWLPEPADTATTEERNTHAWRRRVVTAFFREHRVT